MIKKCFVFSFWLGLFGSLWGQVSEQSFQNPPTSARAYTWWHWMGGNVSQQGIEKDLAAMHQFGLGGFQNFNADLGVARGKDAVDYASPEWFELFGYSAQVADKYGLQMGAHNCAGWSSSGGPWITPEYASKIIVWSETVVEPGTSGNIKLNEFVMSPDAKALNYYKEIAVLAVPTLPGDAAFQQKAADAQTKKKYKPHPAKFRRLKVWKDNSPKMREFTIQSYHAKALQDLIRHREMYVSGTKQKPLPESIVVKDSDVIDVTDKLGADGMVNWTPPANSHIKSWTLLRIGYAPTSFETKPSTKGGTGLEIDKLSRAALDQHWKFGPARMIEAAKGTKSFSDLAIDSYETGINAWTEGFEEQFADANGYRMRRWLPTVAGYVINSVDQTERFLWDYRRTAADLFIDNYFTYFKELCVENGMIMSGETYGNGNFDVFRAAKIPDVPMCEFWYLEDYDYKTYPTKWPVSLAWPFTKKVVTSAAHLSGKPVVGAECPTSKHGWDTHPFLLKPMLDYYVVGGVNRFYFHTMVHQPWDDEIKPGMSMSAYGQQINRNNVWYSQARTWSDYMARTQYLLQSGTIQNDFLVICGNLDAAYNYYVRSGGNQPKFDPDHLPGGATYDIGGTDTLPDLSVDKDGTIRVTHKGKKLDVGYQAILLERSQLLLPENMELLGKLADAGAKIYGARPESSPTMRGYPESEAHFQKLVTHYFDGGQIQPVSAMAAEIERVGRDLILPEGIIGNRSKNDDMTYYFVANQTFDAKPQAICDFRIAGYEPEIWDPETGERYPAKNWQSKDGRTQVTFDFSPVDSIFVVFKKPTDSTGKSTPAEEFASVLNLSSDWMVQFDPQWGMAEEQSFPNLAMWNTSLVNDIKFYSGTAVYKKKFKFKPKRGKRYQLNLGEVHSIAGVKLNGREFPNLWKPPFVLDVSDALKRGENTLEITVTNVWKNRLIGDTLLPEKVKRKGYSGVVTEIPEWVEDPSKMPAERKPRTFLIYQPYLDCKKMSSEKIVKQLAPSGLAGPVQLYSW